MGKMIFAAIVSVLFATGAWAETIKVGGSGGMITLVTELSKAYMAKHHGDVIDVMQQSIEAKGGIMGAAEGMLDIGMAARLVRKDELALGLVASEIARVAGVVAVNAESVKLASIKSSQLCEIYSGQIRNWKELGGHDAAIRVFTKPDADSTKGVIRDKIPCFSKLSEAPHVVVMPKAQDMFNALVYNRDSIGITDVVAVDDSRGKLRALNLDGVVPSEENVKSGKWPVVKHYTLVTKGEPGGLAKRFIDFVRSAEGARIISKNRAVPAK